MSEKIYTIEEIKKMPEELLEDKPVHQVILYGPYAKPKATETRVGVYGKKKIFKKCRLKTLKSVD